MPGAKEHRRARKIDRRINRCGEELKILEEFRQGMGRLPQSAAGDHLRLNAIAKLILIFQAKIILLINRLAVQKSRGGEKDGDIAMRACAAKDREPNPASA